MSLLVSLPSVFEEVAFRGVILTLFLSKTTKWQSIVISAAAFSLMHLLNLLSGRELTWVVGQLGWSFLIGLFYGYLFVRSQSLMPAMIVHYLGNAFVGSLTGSIANLAPVETQVVYGVLFTFGLLPSLLMILWVKFFADRWLPLDASSGEDSVVSQ